MAWKGRWAGRTQPTTARGLRYRRVMYRARRNAWAVLANIMRLDDLTNDPRFYTLARDLMIPGRLLRAGIVDRDDDWRVPRPPEVIRYPRRRF